MAKKKTLQQSIDGALELLPPVGQVVEFDTFKGQLYATDPDGGKDAFTHIIKNNLVKRDLVRNAEGAMVVQLSRKA